MLGPAAFALTLLVWTASAQPAAVDPPAEKVTRKIKLFNGKNLDGWYTWLREARYDDPARVYSVQNGMLRISGEQWGGIATRKAYRDYHLIVEWKWGAKTWGSREKASRDSGILVHGLGEDGAYSKTWLESIESQIIEGGAGDFIMVGGRNKPRMTADVRTEGNQAIWQKGGTPMTKESGRFNWWGRDAKWTDTLGFRGAKDVEKSAGEWNRQEVICDGDTITNIVNGVVVNYGYNSSHTAGKIQLQSEGAEILFRRVELRPIKKHLSHR
ncbi:MAG: DUF1080 domain-containing protein [Acidobacteria bacterium]|nr:DUF1080 domain-containing protein [Acidobacteriota bacterium]